LQVCVAQQIAIVGCRPNPQHVFNREEDDWDKFEYEQFRGPRRFNGGNRLQCNSDKAHNDERKQKRIQSASGDFVFRGSLKKWPNILTAIQRGVPLARGDRQPAVAAFSSMQYVASKAIAR
jgi:hypothetical protein